jgi:hypothetical protein
VGHTEDFADGGGGKEDGAEKQLKYASEEGREISISVDENFVTCTFPPRPILPQAPGHRGDA